ncbi:MAG: SlyX family protein, partial [Pseudohongiellaceae bacterium]
MNPQLEELQMHIAFQEHTLSELNEALISQQKQLDLLRLEVRMLREKLGDVEGRLDSKPGSGGG